MVPWRTSQSLGQSREVQLDHQSGWSQVPPGSDWQGQQGLHTKQKLGRLPGSKGEPLMN